MKHFFRFSVSLLLFTSQTCFGQDTSYALNSNWNNLKTQLQRRTGIATNLTNVLSKSSKVDKEQLKNAKTFSVDLFEYVDSLNSKDSLSISLASDKNNKLTQALARALATLENDSKFKSRKDVIGLIMQLEGCENRIALAKKEYNDLCKVYGRLDLLFGKEQPEKATQIEF